MLRLRWLDTVMDLGSRVACFSDLVLREISPCVPRYGSQCRCALLLAHLSAHLILSSCQLLDPQGMLGLSAR